MLTLSPDVIVEEPLTHLGSLDSDVGPLPLRSVTYDVTVDGLVARARCLQQFDNPLSTPAEVIYVFPLPDRAAVVACSATLGGRVVRARIAERQAARVEYQNALAEGRRAALVEEDRPEVFSLSLGNLAPGESATIELELVVPLSLERNEATLRLPICVAPRYVGGLTVGTDPVGRGDSLDTTTVPDASRVTPPVLSPGSDRAPALRANVRVRAGGLSVLGVRASLYSTTTRHDGETLIVELDESSTPDRDLILRLALKDELSTTASSVPDDRSVGNGTLALTVIAPTDPSARPRDVAIVLDRSGSMGGWKMIAARRAAARLVESLGPDDRVWVCGFDHALDVAPATAAGLTHATDRVRWRACEFLARLDARGGTELAAALLCAAATLATRRALAPNVPASTHPDRDAVMVVVTDGQVAAEDHLLAQLHGRLEGVTVLTVGIDRAVNAGLLHRLSPGAGMCELVESEDQLDDAMVRLTRRVVAPALTGLHLEDSSGRLDLQSLAPTGQCDVAPGAPAQIFARYHGDRPASVIAHATRPDGTAWKTQVPVTTDESSITVLWARARIRDLEDQLAVRHDEDIEAELLAISLAFSVLCRYSAFIAVSDDGDLVEGAAQPLVQPTQFPDGWANHLGATIVARTETLSYHPQNSSGQAVFCSPPTSMTSTGPMSPENSTAFPMMLSSEASVARAIISETGQPSASWPGTDLPGPLDSGPHSPPTPSLTEQLTAKRFPATWPHLTELRELLHELSAQAQLPLSPWHQDQVAYRATALATAARHDALPESLAAKLDALASAVRLGIPLGTVVQSLVEVLPPDLSSSAEPTRFWASGPTS